MTRHGHVLRRILPLLVVASGAIAASACEENELSRRDTAMGVVDSAPYSAARSIALALTDENVVALLDTAYALLIQTETLAQRSAGNEEVREFARGAIPAHSLARQGIAAQADRLKIGFTLPDDEVIERYREALPALQQLSGEAFDRAYLDWEIDAHEELIDEIEDSLEAARSSDALRPFLEQLKTGLEADLARLRAIRTSAAA